MSDTAVKVENLGKKYIIGHRDIEFARFNERLTQIGRNILCRLRHPLRPYDASLKLEDFWAVRNVSFELKKGDRLGIIGHNGSGKSTMLKMLSRITTPTEGRITMTGRVASLLEVGTGFHDLHVLQYQTAADAYAAYQEYQDDENIIYAESATVEFDRADFDGEDTKVLVLEKLSK